MKIVLCSCPICPTHTGDVGATNPNVLLTTPHSRIPPDHTYTCVVSFIKLWSVNYTSIETPFRLENVAAKMQVLRTEPEFRRAYIQATAKPPPKTPRTQAFKEAARLGACS